MAQINLAPGTQYLAAVRRRRQSLYALSGGIALVVIAIWGGLFLIQQSAERQRDQVNAELAAVETEITRLGPDVERIELFEGRLEVLNQLLNQHVSWTPLLAEFERLLPPASVLLNMTISHDASSVEISGTTPNIDELAQLLASLISAPERPTPFSDAEISGVQINREEGEGGEITSINYEFSATLRLAEPPVGQSL